MIKTFKYIGIAILSAGILTSCDEDDSFNDETVDLGGYAYLTDQNLSVFDSNETLNIDIFTQDGVTAESVDLLQDGQSIGNATISENSASFNSSVLGNFTLEDDETSTSYDLTIETTYSNGNISTDNFSIGVDQVISLGDENVTTIELDSLGNASLGYSTFTNSASIDSVNVYLKRNMNGTYISNNISDFPESGEGQVELSTTNYSELDLAVNDTLYYRFAAYSGDLISAQESSIILTGNEEEQ